MLSSRALSQNIFSLWIIDTVCTTGWPTETRVKEIRKTFPRTNGIVSSFKSGSGYSTTVQCVPCRCSPKKFIPSISSHAVKRQQQPRPKGTHHVFLMSNFFGTCSKNIRGFFFFFYIIICCYIILIDPMNMFMVCYLGKFCSSSRRFKPHYPLL